MNIVYFASVSRPSESGFTPLFYGRRGEAVGDISYLMEEVRAKIGARLHLQVNQFSGSFVETFVASRAWESGVTLLAYDVPRKQNLEPCPSEKIAKILSGVRRRIGEMNCLVMPCFSKNSYTMGNDTALSHQKKLLNDSSCVVAVHPDFDELAMKVTLMRQALDYLAKGPGSDPVLVNPETFASRPKLRFKEPLALNRDLLREDLSRSDASSARVRQLLSTLA